MASADPLLREAGGTLEDIVKVSALARPEWLVEIDVIAVGQNAASGP